MCHFLYIASPLTLSEVRSMLPDGLAADLLPPDECALILPLLPHARTAARLLAGACSCDLFLARTGGVRGEEAELRRRYRALGVGRDAVIRALERHRRAGRVRHLPERWTRLLAALVAEHARNAGPSLYLHQFSATGSVDRVAAPIDTLTVSAVRESPAVWLAEGRPTVVARAA